ncbi:MAG: histidine phosphatase family protein [Deltaproteobacteria bacterium]|nr:histidine phosphatase family protein [Deltaproteobacteria bacterium]
MTKLCIFRLFTSPSRKTYIIIGSGVSLVKLILVRHGQTLWNREKRVQGVSDIALSKRGSAQADSLATAR